MVADEMKCRDWQWWSPAEPVQGPNKLQRTVEDGGLCLVQLNPAPGTSSPGEQAQTAVTLPPSELCNFRHPLSPVHILESCVYL